MLRCRERGLTTVKINALATRRAILAREETGQIPGAHHHPRGTRWDASSKARADSWDRRPEEHCGREAGVRRPSTQQGTRGREPKPRRGSRMPDAEREQRAGCTIQARSGSLWQGSEDQTSRPKARHREEKRGMRPKARRGGRRLGIDLSREEGAEGQASIGSRGQGQRPGAKWEPGLEDQKIRGTGRPTSGEKND